MFLDTPNHIADQSQPATETLHWQAFESGLDCPATLCVSEVGQLCIQKLVEMKQADLQLPVTVVEVQRGFAIDGQPPIPTSLKLSVACS